MISINLNNPRSVNLCLDCGMYPEANIGGICVHCLSETSEAPVPLLINVRRKQLQDAITLIKGDTRIGKAVVIQFLEELLKQEEEPK